MKNKYSSGEQPTIGDVVKDIISTYLKNNDTPVYIYEYKSSAKPGVTPIIWS